MKKSNRQNYWFKRRRYGYGWTPVTWQGWATLGVLLAVLVALAIGLLADVPRGTLSTEVGVYLLIVLVVVGVLIVVAYRKGPSPRWRWGKRKGDKPDEDF